MNERSSSKLREKLIEAFRDARKVRIGDKLVIGNTAEVDPLIKKALNRGQTVSEDGVTCHIEWCARIDTTKSASAQYTWDDSGNRVKADKILVIITGSNVTRKILATAFISFDNV